MTKVPAHGTKRPLELAWINELVDAPSTHPGERGGLPRGFGRVCGSHLRLDTLRLARGEVVGLAGDSRPRLTYPRDLRRRIARARGACLRLRRRCVRAPARAGGLELGRRRVRASARAGTLELRPSVT